MKPKHCTNLLRTTSTYSVLYAHCAISPFKASLWYFPLQSLTGFSTGIYQLIAAHATQPNKAQHDYFQFTFQEVLKIGIQNVHPSPERLSFFKLVFFPHLLWQLLEIVDWPVEPACRPAITDLNHKLIQNWYQFQDRGGGIPLKAITVQNKCLTSQRYGQSWQKDVANRTVVTSHSLYSVLPWLPQETKASTHTCSLPSKKSSQELNFIRRKFFLLTCQKNHLCRNYMCLHTEKGKQQAVSNTPTCYCKSKLKAGRQTPSKQKTQKRGFWKRTITCSWTPCLALQLQGWVKEGGRDHHEEVRGTAVMV